jgi:glucose/arabinose dehydrogenase/lysophospholipase L1-like esterase
MFPPAEEFPMRQRGRVVGSAVRAISAVSALLAVSLFPTGPAVAAAPPPGAAPPGGPAPAAFEDVRVTTTQVASGLRRPTTVVGLDDGRLLITEKQGTVRAYHPSTGLAADPVLDLTAKVAVSGNERGLLGITPAPDFAQTRLVYVAYTALADGRLTLSRVPLGQPAREEVLLTQAHAEYGNHNGGHVAFGPDGYLYWVLGDGGGAGDPFNSGQDLTTLLGKVLRLDVSRSCQPLAYCVPEDNPYVGVAGARPEIWVSGVRNAWRFSFDPADRSLWLGDVGQGTKEEIDHLGPDDGGANLGWSCREGTVVFQQERCDPDVEYTDPVFEYRSSYEGCSVIGGQVYRGAQFADLVGGTYVATDYCSSTAWAVRQNGDGTYTTGTIGEFPTQVTSFGVDASGELYVVNDLPGGLHRVSFERVQPAEAVRIMPLGDSITGSPGCWRALLWDQLRNNGFTNVDFVGTQAPQGCGFDYDGEHEGHGGALVTTVADQNQLPPWLAAADPDVVLVHFGTNDVWSNRPTETILAAYTKLVSQMRAQNPTVTVLVAQLIPMNPSGCAECGARVQALNAAIPGWAASVTSEQSRVVVVDQWTGFDTTSDTYDGVHPNAAGDQKLAATWFPAVAGALS